MSAGRLTAGSASATLWISFARTASSMPTSRARDEQGVNERGRADGGIRVGDPLDQLREDGLVHADVAGARRGPAVADRRRLRVDVLRRAGRARGEAGGLRGRGARQLERAADV